MHDVVSIGNATMDAFVQINPRTHFHKKTNAVFFEQGSKIAVEDLRFFSGGSATNTAVSFARQGLNTGILCQIGLDEFGKDILDELRRERVDTSQVISDSDARTAFSVVVTGHGLNRIIFAYGGATRKLDHAAKHIKWNQLAKTRSIYLGSLHSSLSLVEKIAFFCRKNDILFSWNPGQSELRQGLHRLKPILAQTDWLFVNGEEAAQLGGSDNYRENMQRLSKLGPRTVVSLGPLGAAAFNGHKVFFERAHAARKKDTTGAGDAFNSGFWAAYLSDQSLPDCLENGVSNATSVIMHLGAKNKLLKRRFR